MKTKFLRRAAVSVCVVLLCAATLLPVTATLTVQNADTPDDSPMIALTFDDGPSTKSTGKILDALEENGAKATFFVIGQNIAGHADMLLRAQRLGCEIGNHTYDHKKLSELSGEGIARQLQKTDEAIEGILGICPTLVRAPCGRCSGCVKENVDRPIILWSMDTEDWKLAGSKDGNCEKNRQRMIRYVTENARDGDIILMHDIYSLSADCAVEIIPLLMQKGFRLVTVSEMMNRRGIELKSGSIYHSGR